jgi:hypothetical protein
VNYDFHEVTAGAPRADSFDLTAMEVSMATVMTMHWPEVSRQQYEEVRREVNWEGKTPKGANLHVCWFAEDGFHVLDIWESQADFEMFLKQRLTPGIEKAGIKGQPKFEFAQAHAIFAPNIGPHTKIDTGRASPAPQM